MKKDKFAANRLELIENLPAQCCRLIANRSTAQIEILRMEGEDDKYALILIQKLKTPDYGQQLSRPPADPSTRR